MNPSHVRLLVGWLVEWSVGRYVVMVLKRHRSYRSYTSIAPIEALVISTLLGSKDNKRRQKRIALCDTGNRIVFVWRRCFRSRNGVQLLLTLVGLFFIFIIILCTILITHCIKLRWTPLRLSKHR